MGCGMSTLDDENATLRRYSSILRRHSIVRPVTDNNSPTKKLLDNGGDERVIENGGEKEVPVKGAAEKEQSGNGELEKNGENEQVAYQCEYLIAPRSPSFRDYCVDSDSGDQSFREHFNDTDSAESTKNGSVEASAKRNDKPGENKDSKKKERRRLRFRNAINKGMPKGKRNLLNFGCYTSCHASYDDNTLKKVVEKSAR